MISRKENSEVKTRENQFKEAKYNTYRKQGKTFYSSSNTPFKLLHRFVTFPYKMVCYSM